MIRELTIEQASKQPASFMYIFASDKYLSYIDKKYRDIIKTKRDNAIYLLKLSADKYFKDTNKWTDYRSAIATAFEDIYDMTPQKALTKLALGEEVAGKNWAKGVYGVGAVKGTTFVGVELNGQAVTVNPETGHIYCGTQDITRESDTIYQEVKGKTIPYQYCGYSTYDTMSFVSQYNKTTGKYYASTYSSDGVSYDAATNKVKTSSDSATIWESVFLNLQTFIDWILSFFGLGNNSGAITEKDIVPNQKQDGYVTDSNTTEAGGILLLLAAGGALLAMGERRNAKNNK